MFQVLLLVKKGYGTIQDIEALDTPQFLDALEYENILSDIESHEQKEAESKAK